eukprot:Opistho-1_new@35885
MASTIDCRRSITSTFFAMLVFSLARRVSSSPFFPNFSNICAREPDTLFNGEPSASSPPFASNSAIAGSRLCRRSGVRVPEPGVRVPAGSVDASLFAPSAPPPCAASSGSNSTMASPSAFSSAPASPAASFAWPLSASPACSALPSSAPVESAAAGASLSTATPSAAASCDSSAPGASAATPPATTSASAFTFAGGSSTDSSVSACLSPSVSDGGTSAFDSSAAAGACVSAAVRAEGPAAGSTRESRDPLFCRRTGAERASIFVTGLGIASSCGESSSSWSGAADCPRENVPAAASWPVRERTLPGDGDRKGRMVKGPLPYDITSTVDGVTS